MTHTISKIISDETLNRAIHIESNGDPDARASTSTASGLLQFINSTWRTTVAKHRPDLKGLDDVALLRLRFDPELAIEMGARLWEESARVLGASASDGDLYLAHFAGAGTARRAAQADQNAAASTVFSAAQIKANRSILTGKTIGEVRAWASRKMKAASGHDYIAKFWKGGYRKPDRLEEIEDPDDDRLTPAIEGADAGAAETPWRSGVAYPEVREVQRRLKERGYVVGMIDGKWGGATAGAIRSFKTDRHLTGRSEIDQELLNELDKAELEITVEQPNGWVRPVSEARKTADDATIAETAPEIAPAKSGKLWSGITSLGALVSAIVTGVMKFFGDAYDTVASYMGAFDRIPGIVWFGIIAAIAGYMFWRNAQAVGGIRAAFKTGERL